MESHSVISKFSRTLTLFVLCCCLITVPGTASSATVKNLSFRHIAPSQIETIGYINDIIQDTTGFMWFAGANGLARYDGINLKIYRHNEYKTGSLSDNYVDSLLVDREGTLWIGTRAGLNRYQPDSDSFLVYRQPQENSANSSADDILCLFEDSNNRLWLGTRGGLYAFDREKRAYHRFQIHSGTAAIDNVVWSIVEDQQGALWIGNHSSGISKLNLTANNFQHFADFSNNRVENPRNDVRRLFVDSSNTVWAATYGAGILRFNRNTGRFEKFEHEPAHSEKSRVIWDFAEDQDNYLWVGDGSAITVLHPKTGTRERYTHDSRKPDSPGNHVINRVYADRSGNIWVGYFPSGIDIVDRQAAVFQNYLHNPDDPNTITDGGILSAAEDALGNLWVGAGYGLNYVNRSKGTIKRIQYDPQNPDGLNGNTILSIELDQDTLWLGVWSGGLNRYDLKTGIVTHYLPQKNSQQSLLGKEPWALMRDSQQRLWIASEAGISLYHPETDDFTRFLPKRDQMDNDHTLYSRALMQDHKGRIWIGASRGLFHLDPDSHRFIRYQPIANDPHSLSHEYVISLYEDSQQRFWVGTHGGGLNLFDPETETFTRFDEGEALKDQVITAIIEGADGNLWLSSQQGLIRFDPVSGGARNYNQTHGLSGNLFNRNTALETHDKQLFFGNTRGFMLFDPREIQANNQKPPVVFTGLRLFNQPVTSHQPGSVLSSAIQQAPDINISRQQTMITVEFAALNYRHPEHNQYAFKLDGFDRDWLYVGNQHQATYTNLDSGNYRLHVRAANNDGIWNDEGAAINIIVSPLWWNTWWAYCVYVAIASFLLFALATLLVRHKRSSYERQLQERMQEINQSKREFLGNTAHKLRTPVLSIVGLSENLIYHPKLTLPGESRDYLNMIAASGKRLSGLINAIVDYSEICDRSLELKLQPVNLFILTEMVFSLLAPLAKTKPIRMVNALSPNMARVIADEKRLQQILLHLVENGIKNTREGFITVSGEIHGDQIKVIVEDSGMGIPEDRISTLFVPFQHAAEASDAESHSLGLAICHKLVELLGSELKVSSAVGIGTEFSFQLPITRERQADNDQFQHDSSTMQKVADESLSQLDASSSALTARIKTRAEDRERQFHVPDDAARYTILIVEDDKTHRMVLNSMLGICGFQVLEACCGSEALQQLKDHNDINLVLMDALMPDMNGYDTCKAIRKKRTLTSLPVIFISACSRERDIAAAYESGASDFLSKPVNTSELIAKINVHLRMIKNRQ